MDKVTLSPEQLHQLSEMVERDGFRRIVIENQNGEETLIVVLDGRKYWMRHTGETGVQQL